MTSTYVRSTDAEERWLLYDATEHNLGRMAASIARALQGKDRPTYQPNEKTGAHVVVINGSNPRMSGNKRDIKIYKHYTGYPGGLKEVAMARVLESRPADAVTLAVRRMLPKNRLGHDLLRRLKVYAGEEHPHTAQAPVKVASV
ncbi:MAG: 50S ribosomal protein L13 [Planctomycetota bacterium]